MANMEVKTVYKHIETGKIAIPYALYDLNNVFIEPYWVVPGLPDNFYVHHVQDETIFEKTTTLIN